MCLIREVRSFGRQYSALLGETAEVLAQYLGAVRHPRVVDVATQVQWGHLVVIFVPRAVSEVTASLSREEKAVK